MNVTIEKKFRTEVVYNGVEKPIQVEAEERVTALIQRAIAAFGVTQQPHLLSLFRQDGTVVNENQSVEQAGLKPHEVLLLRPNAVKGGSERLKVAGEVLPATFRMLQECGQGQCECVVYWTGSTSSGEVDGVEHPEHTRSPFGYEVRSQWLTDFWKRLASSRRSVRAQVHTHPDEPFHSSSDDRWPIVSQAGFISIVLPNFALGRPTLHNAWVGVILRDGRWRQLESASEVLVMP